MAGRQPPRRLGVLLAVAVAVYLADVISKVLVVATLPGRPPIRLLGGLLTLRVLRNSGAAFSIGTSLTVAFTVIAVAVIFVILRMSWRLRSLPWAIALGLLLGGATGNLTDRLLRSPGVFRGDVVDWIQLPHWPVFNVADSAIVCGVVIWALLLARGVPLNGQRAPRATAVGDDGRDASGSLDARDDCEQPRAGGPRSEAGAGGHATGQRAGGTAGGQPDGSQAGGQAEDGHARPASGEPGSRWALGRGAESGPGDNRA